MRRPLYALALIATATTLLSNSSLVAGEASLTGRWKGAITFEDQSYDYYLDIHKGKKGLGATLISPRSGKYPAKKFTLKDNALSILVDRNLGAVDQRRGLIR